jgi:hypothetical protein
MSLIVNEKRLPATVKRLFKNSVAEIVGELLQNSQRAGSKEIYFRLDRDERAIRVRDDGSGVSPDIESWSRILRMADSFYSNELVETNQKPMGIGLLSLFALDRVKSVSISSRGKFARLETNLLWESESYWANWTNLIADAPENINGFELTVKYDEPEETFSYNRLAHKFEYALTEHGDNGGFAVPRGYKDFLKIFLDGEEVDASIPAECVPSGCDLLYDGFYENNRLRIGQTANPFRNHAYVIWYGQIIRLDSPIPFLLEVSEGNPVTPLAPTRTSLIKDRKLEKLLGFVEDKTFAAFADEETARAAKPAFIKRLYQSYQQRAKKELSVCVVREVASPPDRVIESSDDFYAMGAEKVLSYDELEKRRIDVFDSGVFIFGEARRKLPSYFNCQAEQTTDDTAAVSEWTEMSAGAESFAPVLAGGAIHFLVAGNQGKLSLKNIYWKPGVMLKSVFARAGEFAVIPVDKTPVESDFRPVETQVFVFEYAGNFDIEEIEGLCVGLLVDDESDLLDEAAEWLARFGKACFSPNDDYDYEPQEADFDESVSRLILDLQGDVLSTNWNFNELKTLVGKIVAEHGKSQNSIDSQIKGIEFLIGDGEEKRMIVKLAGETEIRLKIASHTYLS